MLLPPLSTTRVTRNQNKLFGLAYAKHLTVVSDTQPLWRVSETNLTANFIFVLNCSVQCLQDRSGVKRLPVWELSYWA